MNIPAFRAQQSYGVAQEKLSVNPADLNNVEDPESGGAFKALHDLVSTVSDGERAATDFLTGGADPHSVVEAIAAAELAVETATAVRDKAVEAFQDILRMPI